MKLGHVDYHGFRGYEPDPASATAASLIERLAGGLSAGVKRVIEMFLKLGARETAETVWLVKGDERHFSVLGSTRDDKRPHTVAPCPFPEGQARTRRAHWTSAEAE